MGVIIDANQAGVFTSFIPFFPSHPDPAGKGISKVVMHKVLLILPRKKFACLKSSVEGEQ